MYLSLNAKPVSDVVISLSQNMFLDLL